MLSLSTAISCGVRAVVAIDTVGFMATVADRIREALALRGMGVNSLDRALGKSPGTTSSMLNRGSEPVLSNAAEIAKVLRVRLEWLATGEGPLEIGLVVSNDADPTSSGRAPLTFRDLPGWAEAVTKAKRRYRRIPEVAWIGAGLQAAQNVNEHIDEAVVLNFAKSWLIAATDDERAAAAEAEGRAAMAAEDEAYRQKLIAFDNPPPPKARKPRTVKAKATTKLRASRGAYVAADAAKGEVHFRGTRLEGSS